MNKSDRAELQAIRDQLKQLDALPEMRKEMRRELRRLENRVRAQQVQIHALNHYIDYLLLHPVYEPDEDLGFNSQDGRKAIFKSLVDVFDFQQIVETGTWVGSTTGYMATRSQLTVHSCDANERYNIIARQRLEAIDNVRLALMDSREFLNSLAQQPEIASTPTFIYLDAHWHQDLPLAEELDIISANWSNAVVMIDDFAVPDDADYSFDDYGPGKVLDVATFGECFQRNELQAWFPSLAGKDETGASRGCILVTAQPQNAALLDTISLLRRIDTVDAG